MPTENAAIFESAETRVRNRYSNVEGPDQLADALQERLQEHLEKIVRGTDREFKRNYKELVETKRLMERGQLGDVRDKENVVNLFNRAITDVHSNSSRFQEMAESMGKSLKDNIPSFDSLVHAMTMANPAIGMGVKFMIQLRQNMKIRNALEKKERQKRLEALISEGKATKEQVEEHKKIVEHNRTERKGKGPLVERMDKLNDETQHQTSILTKLLSVWSDGNEEVIVNLEETRNQEKQLAEKKEEEDKQNKLDIAEDKAEEKTPKLERIVEEKDEKTGGIAFFGRLLGAGGAVAGLFGALMAGLSAIGGVVMAALPFVAIAGGVLLAVYKVFEGIKNAGEILGKTDLNMWDYISAAIGNVVGFFGDMLDWALDLFGIKNTNYGDMLTKNVARWLADLPNKIMAAFDYIKEQVTGAFDKIKEFDVKKYLGDVGMMIFEPIVEIFENIKNAISNYFDTVLTEFAIENPRIAKFFGIEVPEQPLQGSALESDVSNTGTVAMQRYYQAAAEERAQRESAVGASNTAVVNAPTTNNVNNTNNHYGESRSANNNETAFNVLNRGNARYGL